MARVRTVAAAVAMAAVLTGAPAPAFAGAAASTGTAALPAARAGMEAVTLADGRVLVAGGDPATSSGAAVVYDPAADRWSPTTPHTAQRRTGHTLTLLTDGRVLVAGGGQGPALYDPAADTWTVLTAPDSAYRTNGTATRLPDGRVLLAGGREETDWPSGDRYDTAVVHDPAAGTWTTTGRMAGQQRGRSTAVPLPDGSVLYGGIDPDRAPVERWDPVTNQWSRVPVPRTASGRLVAVPGSALLVAEDGTTFVFGAATGEWRAGGTMAGRAAPWGHPPMLLTALPTGEVLASGGGDPARHPHSEVYDPDTDLWRDADVAVRRAGHVAALLGTGDVLLVAGTPDGTSAERLTPPPATTAAQGAAPRTTVDVHLTGGSPRANVTVPVVARLFGADFAPLAGEPVVFYRRADGAAEWTRLGEATTDESGYAAVRTTPAAGQARYVARHPATATAAASASPAVTLTTTASPRPPAAPDAALAQGGDGSVRVSWLPPADDGGSPLTSYQLRLNEPVSGVKHVTVDASQRSVVVTGLRNGGYYDVSVDAVNAAGSSGAAGAGTVRARADAPPPRPPVAGTPACGRLPHGDTRWTAAGGPYTVCELGLIVPFGSRLLVEGATVRFLSPTDRTAQRFGLSVRGGELRTTAGTVLRGIDGVPGEWTGVQASSWHDERPRSSGVRDPDAVDLAGTELRHAADGVLTRGRASWLRLAGTTIGDVTDRGVLSLGAGLRATDLRVERVGGNGVDLGCGWAGDPRDKTCVVDVRGLVVDRAGGRGLSVSTAGSVAVPDAVVTNSGHTAPVTEAARFVGTTAAFGTGGDVDVRGGGNAIDAIVLDGVATRDLAWRTAAATPAGSPAPLGFLVGSLALAPGRSVTFPPGSVVKGYAPRYDGCSGCTGGISVDGGTIDAGPGTVFTSTADDSAGVRTCPSVLAATCEPTSHDWWGLRARGDSVVRLAGTDVRHATEGLVAGVGVTTVTGGTFTGNGTAISARTGPVGRPAGSLTLSGTTFVGNEQAVSVVNAASFTAEQLTVRGGRVGVRVDGAPYFVGCGTYTRTVSIRGFLAEDVGDAALHLRGLCRPVVRDVVVRRSGWSPLPYYATAPPPVSILRTVMAVGPGRDVDGFTGGGNRMDVVALNGVVEGGLDWVAPVDADADHALGYLVGPGYEHGTGIDVRDGDLTVPAGALVAFADGSWDAPSITVTNGSLDASAGGARFLSYTDPGATEIGCAGLSPCRAGDWGNITVRGSDGGPAGDLLLADATIRGGHVTVHSQGGRADGVVSVTGTTSDDYVTAERPGRFELTGSRVRWAVATEAGGADVARTTATGPGDVGLAVTGRGDTRITLRDNTAGNVAGPAFLVGKAAVSFGPGGDVDGNVGYGDSAAIALAGVTAASDLRWISPTAEAAPHPAGYVVAGATWVSGASGGLTVPAPYTLTMPRDAVAKVGGGIRLTGGTLDATAGGALFTTLGDDSVGVPTCNRAYRDTSECGDPLDMRWPYLAGITSVPGPGGSAGGVALHRARVYGSVTVTGPAGDAPGATGFGLVMDESFAKTVQVDGTPASVTRSHVAYANGVNLARSDGNVVRDVLVERTDYHGIDLLDASATVTETVVRDAGRIETPLPPAPGGLRVRGTSSGTFSCLDLRGNRNGLTALGNAVTLTDSVLTGNTSRSTYGSKHDLWNDAVVTTGNVYWGQPGGPLPGQVKDPAKHVGMGAALVAPECARADAATPPTAPRAVTVTPGDARLTAAWDVPYTDGRSAVTAYRVTVAPGGATVEVPGDRRGATVTGLANGTAYAVTVTAVNAVGDSVPSRYSAPATPAAGESPSPSASATPSASPSPTASPAGPASPPATPTATPSPSATAASRVTTALAIAAPGFVTYGTAAVVTGRLTAAGAALPGRPVRVYVRRAGSGTWGAPRATLTTGTDGRVSYRFTPAERSEAFVAYSGDTTTLPTSSRLATVQVRPRITAAFARASGPYGTVVALRGRVSPVLAGRPVRLERYTRYGWRTVTRAYLSSTSTYRFSVRTPARGTFAYRVVYDTTTRHARGVSPTVRLTAS